MASTKISVAHLTEVLDRTNPPEYVAWNRKRITSCIHFLHRHLTMAGKSTLDVGHDVHVGALLVELGANLTGNVAPDELHGHENARGSHSVTDQHGVTRQWQIDAFDFEKDFPYAPATFDVVTAMEVIEHVVHSPRKFLSSIKRVLKPDGYLFIGTPNAAAWAKVVRQLAHAPTYDAKPYSQDFGPRHPMCHVYEYTPWELKELLRSEGFEIIAMETWDPYTSDPRGLRNQIQKLFLLAGLILTFDWKKAALLYRNRGHQIGLLARAR